MPRTQLSVDVEAPLEQLMSIITDFRRYPEFLPEIEHVEILEESDSEWKVRFKLRLVRRLEYTLQLVRESPGRIRWSLVDGIFKSNDGFWELESIGESLTRGTYDIDIVFGLFVPAAIVNTLVGRNLPDTLARFKSRVETHRSPTP